MDRDPRINPEPGDVVQVRPWRDVETRTVVEMPDTIVDNGDSVAYKQEGRNNTFIIPLEIWQKDAERPLEITPEEEENWKRLAQQFAVIGRAEALCRADGFHCLSCLDGSDKTEEDYYEMAEGMTAEEVQTYFRENGDPEDYATRYGEDE